MSDALTINAKNLLPRRPLGNRNLTDQKHAHLAIVEWRHLTTPKLICYSEILGRKVIK